MAALLAIAVSAYAAPQAVPPPPPPAVSQVYSISDSSAINGFEENPATTRALTDRLILAVTGQSTIAAAWRTLVSPEDKVGIKISTEGGHYLHSHQGIITAVCDGLEAAGIPRSKIIIWDRESANLKAAGYFQIRGGPRLLSIDPPRGFDPQAKIVAPILGKLIWGDFGFNGKKVKGSLGSGLDELSSESHFATILTQEVTKVINVPVFCESRGCGVAGALYNMTIPNMDNCRRFMQPGGSSSIIDAYMDPRVGPKVVLTIMDGLIAQYAGGPDFNSNYAINFHTLYASKDPVAIDATVLRLIEEWRKDAKLPPSKESAAWIQEGEVMGLGHFAEEAIELRPVGLHP